MTGEKEQLEGYAISLGRKGYVCVSNAYRMASDPATRPEKQANPDHFAAEEAKWPAMIHDCKAAVRWMRANCGELGISPDHIAVTGNSAGISPTVPEFSTQFRESMEFPWFLCCIEKS